MLVQCHNQGIDCVSVSKSLVNLECFQFHYFDGTLVGNVFLIDCQLSVLLINVSGFGFICASCIDVMI